MTDDRGDIGAWVREACMTALHDATAVVMDAGDPALADDVSGSESIQSTLHSLRLTTTYVFIILTYLQGFMIARSVGFSDS